MKAEMRSYVVSVACNHDDDVSYHYIHFVTEYPVNSVGFWEDFYDTCFDTFDFTDSYSMLILEVEEGF